MKKLFLLSFSLLCTVTVNGQNKALKISSTSSSKEIIIKENKRIKIKTIDGRQLRGRFKTVGESFIIIDDVKVDLQHIKELKRNPQLTSIITTASLVFLGTVTAGLGILIGALSDSTAFWLTLPGAAMIYLGLKSPNLYKKHSIKNGLKLEISNIP
tara:strand:+ start:63 stop:530 length:468 start_codon:yes stop_codon:yes gene_type:complete